MSKASRAGLAGFALALAVLSAGCATPVGVETEDPRAVALYLTRSVLTGDQPSDFSKIELRRYQLLEAYDEDPDAALAKLHQYAVANGLPQEALFALAELSFLRADADQSQESYAATAVYAYALLFPEGGRAPLNRLDPRERVTADLYNRALTLAFKRTTDGTLAMTGTGVVELPFGRLVIDLAPDVLRVGDSELYALQPVAELQVRGFRNRYRWPGIGAPLAAKTRPLPGVVQVVPVGPIVRAPVTAVVRIDSPLAGIRSGELHGRIDFFTIADTETIEIDGRTVPLEAEPTATLAATLTESQFWKQELARFFGEALGVQTRSGLGAMLPYKRGQIPVVFVHGTASSPPRWADMVNDLWADPRVRHRYAFWFFAYDSGNPILYSAQQLRQALVNAVGRADPGGTDPCVHDMVVLGHSQGGLLTKLTAVDSGDRFWAGVTDQPFDEISLDPEDKELLRSALFVKPLPFVSEVIFLATPHRGSYLAGPQLVRRLAEYFVRLPSNVARVSASVIKLGAAGARGLGLTRIPTSIDNMSPGNRLIKSLSDIPVDPRIRAHSIISVNDDAPLEEAGDGVVKYESAHIDGVASELIVHSPHSGMQAAPETVEEVRRILLEHSARSTCPMPLPGPS